MSKTSDKDPVRFSSPYEHKETVGDVAINEQPIKWFPTKMPQIDPLITAKEVAYYIDRINELEIENKRLDDERLTALADMFDVQQHLSQLQNELAEFQNKPEAFERLRELLRKERQMRKQDNKRFYEVCDERDTAQAAHGSQRG